jgi:hypothetical protein
MKVVCNLELEYDSNSIAKKVLSSTKVDDYNFVDSNLNNNKIETKIECKSVSSLIHTLDDYLACISIAEKIVSKK